jgi:hypothetical protein
LRELGWLGSHTMVVIVADGAEWIWNRATWFIRRCEVLDFYQRLIRQLFEPDADCGRSSLGAGSAAR